MSDKRKRRVDETCPWCKQPPGSPCVAENGYAYRTGDTHWLDDGPQPPGDPRFTPERFQEVFQAAIAVGCHGNPPFWQASTPLLETNGAYGEPKGTGATLAEAIGHLVVLATKQAKDKLDEARAELAHAEERWSRIEAAANEMTADGKR